MTASTLELGDFEFRDFEIPEEMAFGGVQMIKVHRMQGGDRVVDAMGPDWEPISWNGRFRGSEAIGRAKTLEAMWKLGKPVALIFSEFAYTVTISSFRYVLRGNNELPYSITLEVASDDAAPNSAAQGISATEMVGADLVDGSAALGGFSSLSIFVANVQTAAGKVRSFTSAVRSEVAAVIQPVIALRSAVTDLITDAEDTLATFQAVGGVSTGIGGAALTSGLLQNLEAMQSVASLYEGATVFGRMERNLDAIGFSGAHVITSGADLFKLAAAAYGDATEWSTIAQANGLSDPIVPGVAELVIPPTPSHTGGVFG